VGQEIAVKILLSRAVKLIRANHNISIGAQSLTSHIKGRLLPKLPATKNSRGYWEIDTADIASFLKARAKLRAASMERWLKRMREIQR